MNNLIKNLNLIIVVVFCFIFNNIGVNALYVKGISSNILNIQASSIAHSAVTTDYIRLNYPNACWSAAFSDQNQYIVVGSPEMKEFSQVQTQGGVNNDYVTSVTIQYSEDGINYQNYVAYNGATVFTANSNTNTIASIILNPPVYARNLKIIPKTWVGWISMRMEVYYRTVPALVIGEVKATVSNGATGSGYRFDYKTNNYYRPQYCETPRVELGLKSLAQTFSISPVDQVYVNPAIRSRLSVSASYKNSFIAAFSVWADTKTEEVSATFLSTCEY
eukprot:gene4633-5787_t